MAYRKVKPLERAQNELIGKKIADIYGLFCPKCHIRNIDDYVYEVVSEDINALGTFKNGVLFDYDATNIYDIWCRLDIKNYDTKRIMPDIFRTYIFDILFGNPDRHTGNWGIINTPEGERVVILDNEFLFSQRYAPYILSDTKEVPIEYKNAEEVNMARMRDIKFFLYTYANEYIGLFRDLLYRIPPEKLESIFDEVEKESGTKIVNRENKLKLYQDTFTASCNLLEELDKAMGRK